MPITPTSLPWPVLVTDAGTLVGPVLLGPPELAALRRTLQSGGELHLPGYNGAVSVRVSPERDRVDAVARAARFLADHHGPEWNHHHAGPDAADAFLHALDTAAGGDLAGVTRVHGNRMRLHLGQRTLHLPASLTGRYRHLINLLRGGGNVDTGWYGPFDLSVRGTQALIETPEGNVLTGAAELAGALEDALQPTGDPPSPA